MSGVKLAILSIVLFNVACFLGQHAQGLGSIAYWADNPYAYSEWLINYSGGFVRRGFGGEVLRRLAGDGSPAGLMSYVTFWAAATFLAAFLVLVAVRWRRLGVGSLAVALLAPGAVAFLYVSEELLFRKELFFHVLTFLNLLMFSAAARSNRPAAHRAYLASAFVLFSVFGGALALTHEAYLFMAAPINLLISACLFVPQDGARRALSKAAFIQCVPLVAVLVCMGASGNPAVAQAVWNSLAQVDRELIHPADPGAVWGGIASIGWNIPHALELTALTFFGGKIMLWVLIVPVTVGLMLWLGCDFASPADREKLAGAGSIGTWAGVFAANAIVFASILPMYVIGWDYGRWTSCYAVGMTLATLVAPELFQRTLRLLPDEMTVRLLAWMDPFDTLIRTLITLGLARAGTVFAVLWLAFVRIDVTAGPDQFLVKGIVPSTLYRAASASGRCADPEGPVTMVMCGRAYEVARLYNHARLEPRH